MEKQIERARKRRDSRISIALTDSFSIDHMRILIHRINRDFDDEVNFIIKGTYLPILVKKRLKPRPVIH